MSPAHILCDTKHRQELTVSEPFPPCRVYSRMCGHGDMMVITSCHRHRVMTSVLTSGRSASPLQDHNRVGWKRECSRTYGAGEAGCVSFDTSLIPIRRAASNVALLGTATGSVVGCPRTGQARRYLAANSTLTCCWICGCGTTCWNSPCLASRCTCLCSLSRYEWLARTGGMVAAGGARSHPPVWCA